MVDDLVLSRLIKAGKPPMVPMVGRWMITPQQHHNQVPLAKMLVLKVRDRCLGSAPLTSWSTMGMCPYQPSKNMGGRAHSRIDTFEQDHFLPKWSLVPVGPSTTNVVCGNAVPKAGYARKPPAW